MKYEEIKALIEEYVKENNNNINCFTDNTFIKKSNKQIKEKYKRTYIKRAVDKGIIYKYFNNKYKLTNEKEIYTPFINEKLEKNIKKIFKNKNFIVSYLDTSIINQFSELQTINNYILIETPKASIDYLLSKLNSNKIPAITYKEFLKIRNIHNYSINIPNIIIKPLSYDAPLIKSSFNIIMYPKIEKIMVDLLSDKYLYNQYSFELDNIYRNILNKYRINLNTLIRYSSKKLVKEKMLDIIKNLDFDIRIGEFKNDKSITIN